MFKNSIKLMSLILMAGLVIFSSCKKDEEDEDPPVIVLDGIYITGVAAPYNGYDAKGMMAVTRNEVTQTERASLYEIYVPLKAHQDFSIVQVEGSVYTTYSPGADWGVVAEPTNDEPKDVDIQRGAVEETGDAFSVDVDGMYHVVIDLELMKALVCEVQWGVIGAATPDGWGTSTVLPSTTGYNPNNMTWEITEMELRGGDWKFRYSNGWKIELDTTLDLGGGDKGVKVNTNYGGAVDALVPGGDNIVNDAPGVYTINMDWVIGEGFTAILTKTGDLPLTNWTDVVCDAVGSGVSADNPDAIPDPSGWGWGNQLIGDNAGIPTVNGDEYTWTWTGIILEADEGFKVRTLNGEAPPIGGANFDAGYGDLDADNSSTHVYDNGGNLSVDLKAAYNITLVIDAANDDVKTITITE
ncbi:MAG: hypothetical protein ABFS05_01645 [Bacteroidota bacterium]